jgi:hypothetical protein
LLGEPGLGIENVNGLRERLSAGGDIDEVDAVLPNDAR